MRIAVLVKQVPVVESLQLLPNGRLRRDGIELEMNAYCRRAVSKGVALAGELHGSCVAMTLGPPTAEEVLREAVAWGCDKGILITDPTFAGSDTLATATALAAALRREGPFDLMLVGRNSVDADTGQVGPEIAELLDLPFAPAAREMGVEDGMVVVRCELDDGWRSLRVTLPAVVSVAERLCEPAKVTVEGRAAVSGERLQRLSAAALGPGPWGQAASRTVVGRTRMLEVQRRRLVLSGSATDQVAQAVELLGSWGALPAQDLSESTGGNGAGEVEVAALVRQPGGHDGAGTAGSPPGPRGRTIVVLAEPDRPRVVAELLGEAHRLAVHMKGEVVLVGPAPGEPAELWRLGADRVVAVEGQGAMVEEDLASVVGAWCGDVRPWAVLAPGTLWGREVASRVAARLGAGLTGDAVELEVDDEGRLACWKPAFGGRLVAAIAATSDVQMATVRPGVLAVRPPRGGGGIAAVTVVRAEPRRRVSVIGEGRDDDVLSLLGAKRVVAVGTGVAPEEYGALSRLLLVLGAELAATRKVTDRGWLPRARQVGLTGHHVAPDLYMAVGVAGKFNHMVGARAARTIVAVNVDSEAPVFEWADIGLVGDWHEVVPLLAEAIGVAVEAVLCRPCGVPVVPSTTKA